MCSLDKGKNASFTWAFNTTYYELFYYFELVRFLKAPRNYKRNFVRRVIGDITQWVSTRYFLPT